eukprot:4703731-Prymnesium_polylepis.4
MAADALEDADLVVDGLDAHFRIAHLDAQLLAGRSIRRYQCNAERAAAQKAAVIDGHALQQASLFAVARTLAGEFKEAPCGDEHWRSRRESLAPGLDDRVLDTRKNLCGRE